MGGVEFEENDNFEDIPELKIEPPTMEEGLLRVGVVKNPGDAVALMAIIAFLLITESIFLMASAVPPPKTLGDDVLRSGEVVPEYIK